MSSTQQNSPQHQPSPVSSKRSTIHRSIEAKVEARNLANSASAIQPFAALKRPVTVLGHTDNVSPGQMGEGNFTRKETRSTDPYDTRHTHSPALRTQHFGGSLKVNARRFAATDKVAHNPGAMNRRHGGMRVPNHNGTMISPARPRQDILVERHGRERQVNMLPHVASSASLRESKERHNEGGTLPSFGRQFSDLSGCRSETYHELSAKSSLADAGFTTHGSLPAEHVRGFRPETVHGLQAVQNHELRVTMQGSGVQSKGLHQRSVSRAEVKPSDSRHINPAQGSTSPSRPQKASTQAIEINFDSMFTGEPKFEIARKPDKHVDVQSLYNICVDPAGFALLDLRPHSEFSRAHVPHSLSFHSDIGSLKSRMAGRRVVLITESVPPAWAIIRLQSGIVCKDMSFVLQSCLSCHWLLGGFSAFTEAFPSLVILPGALTLSPSRPVGGVDRTATLDDQRQSMKFSCTLPSCILPNQLYLGGVSCIKESTCFEVLPCIKLVVSLTRASREAKLPSHVKHIMHPFPDEPSVVIDPFLQLLIPQIMAAIQQGQAVLVHCRHGKSRAAAVVLATLMCLKGANFAQAHSFVKARRRIICINHGFADQLQAGIKLQFPRQ